MQVIITAPEALELFETKPEGLQDAKFDGNHFYVQNIKIGIDQCTPVFTKKNTIGVSHPKDFELKTSKKFEDVVEFSESFSVQAQIFNSFLKKGTGKPPVSSIERYPINYLHIEDDGSVSYLDYLKAQAIELVGGDLYNNKNRVSASPGTIYGKIFGSSRLSDSTYCEQFQQAIASYGEYDKIIAKGLIKEVEGHEIIKYYNGSHYEEGHGTLNNSCMRYDKCSHFFGIYKNNPSVCKMIVYLNTHGKVMARSLLWTTDTNEKVIDRTYGVNGIAEQMIRNYAKVNGYENMDRKSEPKMRIKLDNFKYDKYPYMDTFKYIDIADGFLYNNNMHKDANQDNLSTISNTSGYRGRANGEVECIGDGRTIMRSQAVWCSYEGGYAAPENVTTCSNGMTCLTRNAVVDAVSGKMIVKDHSIFVENIGHTIEFSTTSLVYSHKSSSYIKAEDAVFCDFTHTFLHKNSVQHIDGLNIEKESVGRYNALKRYSYKENLSLV